MSFHVTPGHTTPAVSRHGLVLMLRLLAAAAVVLPLLLLLSAGILVWRNQKREAWIMNDRLTELAASNVSRLLHMQMLVLDQAAALSRELDAPPAGPLLIRLTERLAEMRGHMPYVREICVVGPDGRVILGISDMARPGTDLAKYEFIRHFSVGNDQLFVSHPIDLAGQGRVIVVALPRINEAGLYAGVVLSVIDQSYIDEILRNAVEASSEIPGRSMALRRTDGVLLAGYPDRGATEHSPEVAAAMTHGSGTTGRTVLSRFDEGAEYLTSWRRLAELNVAIVASVPQSMIVHAWMAHLLPHLYFGIPASLCLFVMTLFALRRQRQSDAAARTAEEERQRREIAEEAHRQGQKMEALGKLTGGVAHDFNNLLAVILGSAELAKGRERAEAERLLDTIIHAGQRASRLTRQLLSFSRTQAVAPRVLNLHADLPRMRAILQPSLRGNIVLSISVPPDVWPVEIDPDEWEIALLNVAVNARDAMPDGGQFSMTVTNTMLRSGDVRDAPELAGEFVAIRLQDSGPGMPPEVAQRAFEPFFTTKEVGRGTGLGLSQVYGFARQAGGSAVVESAGRSGTRITLYLPRSAKPISVAGADDAVRPAAVHPRNRILVVEDSADVASTTSQMLASLGYDVQCSDRAQVALTMLAGATPRFDLLLTDVVMPGGMSGLDLAQAARRQQPDLPIILTSGYADPAVPSPEGFPVLCKPFSLNDLAAAVRACLDDSRVGALMRTSRA